MARSKADTLTSNLPKTSTSHGPSPHHQPSPAHASTQTRPETNGLSTDSINDDPFIVRPPLSLRLPRSESMHLPSSEGASKLKLPASASMSATVSGDDWPEVGKSGIGEGIGGISAALHDSDKEKPSTRKCTHFPSLPHCCSVAHTSLYSLFLKKKLPCPAYSWAPLIFRPYLMARIAPVPLHFS
jgi:hypothetical protein